MTSPHLFDPPCGWCHRAPVASVELRLPWLDAEETRPICARCVVQVSRRYFAIDYTLGFMVTVPDVRARAVEQALRITVATNRVHAILDRPAETWREARPRDPDYTNPEVMYGS